jgi:LysR family transcriptional regulator, hydrogen peroxide-inducible genes activator
MDTHHIRYFLAVCETLNFTRAAHKCDVTQPALSRAIQQLEEEVGAPLFRRERNLTHLTDLALLLRPRLQEIADGLGHAQRDAQRFLTMDAANVTLGIMCTVGPRRFTGLLANFQATQSDVSLQLVEGVPAMLIERLEQGEIDVAIMAMPEGFPETLETTPLYREQFMVAFPAGHRFSELQQVPMAAVDGENYLDRVNCELQHRIGDVMTQCGCVVKVVHQSEREDWIQNMVAGGLGICFLPEFNAVVPGVQTRPVIEPEIWREICLVWRKDRALSPAVQSFATGARNYPWVSEKRLYTE